MDTGMMVTSKAVDRHKELTGKDEICPKAPNHSEFKGHTLWEVPGSQYRCPVSGSFHCDYYCIWCGKLILTTPDARRHSKEMKEIQDGIRERWLEALSPEVRTEMIIENIKAQEEREKNPNITELDPIFGSGNGSYNPFSTGKRAAQSLLEDLKAMQGTDVSKLEDGQ